MDHNAEMRRNAEAMAYVAPLIGSSISFCSSTEVLALIVLAKYKWLPVLPLPAGLVLSKVTLLSSLCETLSNN